MLAILLHNGGDLLKLYHGGIRTASAREIIITSGGRTRYNTTCPRPCRARAPEGRAPRRAALPPRAARAPEGHATAAPRLPPAGAGHTRAARGRARLRRACGRAGSPHAKTPPVARVPPRAAGHLAGRGVVPLGSDGQGILLDIFPPACGRWTACRIFWCAEPHIWLSACGQALYPSNGLWTARPPRRRTWGDSRVGQEHIHRTTPPCRRTWG